MGQVLQEVLADLGEEAQARKGGGQSLPGYQKAGVRHTVLSEQRRIDGRDFTTSGLSAGKSAILSRTHGSAVFTGARPRPWP